VRRRGVERCRSMTRAAPFFSSGRTSDELGELHGYLQVDGRCFGALRVAEARLAVARAGHLAGSGPHLVRFVLGDLDELVCRSPRSAEIRAGLYSQIRFR